MTKLNRLFYLLLTINVCFLLHVSTEISAKETKQVNKKSTVIFQRVNAPKERAFSISIAISRTRITAKLALNLLNLSCDAPSVTNYKHNPCVGLIALLYV